MYHAQTPPPKMIDNPWLEGMTWVDLVFPMFLFAMGMAIPMSLAGRLPQGQPESPADANRHLAQWMNTIGRVLARSLLIAGLAYAVRALSASAISPTAGGGAAILMFFLLLIPFVRLQPKAREISLVINAAGIAVLVMAVMKFGLKDFDPILMALATNLLTSSLIWLCVRTAPSGILAILVVFGVLFLAHNSPGTISQLWHWEAQPGLAPMSFLKYQLITLPGVALCQSILESRPAESSKERLWLGLLDLAGAIIAFTAVQYREYGQALFAAALLGANALWFTQGRTRLRSIQAWGWGMLVIGILCTGLGGIKKDPATLSYLLIAAAISILLYGFIDGLRAVTVQHEADVQRTKDLDFEVEQKERPGFLALVGQNPIFAYLGMTNLLPAAVILSGLDAWAKSQDWTPWGFAGYGLALTLALGAIVAVLSQCRIYFRA